MKKKKVLKTSFVVTFAGTAAALMAPACGPSVTNPPSVACPELLPTDGDPCDPGVGGCVYPDECGNNIEAICDGDSTWTVTYPGTCNPPAPCSAYTTGEICAQDPACVWLVPGCGDPSSIPALPEAGCFDAAPCVDDTSCITGACQQVMVTPSCAAMGCDACGEAVAVCL